MLHLFDLNSSGTKD